MLISMIKANDFIIEISMTPFAFIYKIIDEADARLSCASFVGVVTNK